MAGSESIKYSFRNLKKSKSRSFLTVLSIFAGIATIFVFISFGLGLYTYIDNLSTSSSADKVLIQPGNGKSIGSSFVMDDSDIRAIERTPGVIDVSGSYLKAAQIKKGDEIKYAFMMSYEPRNPIMLDIAGVGIEKGRLLESGDNGKVLLGYNYMLDNKIFSKGLNLNDKVEINNKKVRVVGFFEPVGNPGDDSNIYVTGDFFNRIYDEEKNSYGMIIAKVDKNNVAGISEKIENSLRKHRNLNKGEEDFTVQSFDSLVESYSSALNIVIGFIVLIALISVLVSAVNTANTMITSVLERYKEIGILKAIGARNREIFTIFLFESSFLGFIAGVIGTGFGYLITSITGSVLDSLGWSFLAPYYSWWLFAACIGFAVLTGAISGVIPAINASRINTVDALRYE